MASKATIVHKVAADQAASRISFMAAMEAMLNCSLLLRYQGMPAAISGQVWVSWESHCPLSSGSSAPSAEVSSGGRD
jgi:hypothetical protein